MPIGLRALMLALSEYHIAFPVKKTLNFNYLYSFSKKKNYYKPNKIRYKLLDLYLKYAIFVAENGLWRL